MQLDLDAWDKIAFTDKPTKDEEARVLSKYGSTDMELLVGSRMFSHPIRAIIRSNSPNFPDLIVEPDGTDYGFLQVKTTDNTELPKAMIGKFTTPDMAQKAYSEFLHERD